MRAKLEIMTLSATTYPELFTKVQDFINQNRTSDHWDLMNGTVLFAQNLYYASLWRPENRNDQTF